METKQPEEKQNAPRSKKRLWIGIALIAIGLSIVWASQYTPLFRRSILGYYGYAASDIWPPFVGFFVAAIGWDALQKRGKE